MQIQNFKNLSFAFLFFGCFFLGTAAYCQLPAFNLQITAVDESCTANGVLNFNASNTVAGATIVYSIYHLPNTTTAIAVLSGNTFTGLVAGNYRVVAVQSLGNQSSSQQQDITIVSTIINLTYSLTGIPEVCGNDGKITVNVTHGSGVSYEIFSGPVIRPLQVSNIFSNLPSGSYNVRVFDACGEGVATTYVLDSADNTHLSVNGGNVTLSGCSLFYVSDSVDAVNGGIIAYPITIHVTVHPPSGPVQVFDYAYNSGNSMYQSFSFQIPAIYVQPYTYDVQVIDRCGSIYNRNGLIIQGSQLAMNLTKEEVGCNDFKLSVSAIGGVTPITISFLSAPAGFNPLIYNSGHPGPFGSVTLYYNATLHLPEGTYVVQITDVCGRTAADTITITYSINGGNVGYRLYPGCNIGRSSLVVEGVNPLVSAQLLTAPAGYPFPLPQDLSNYLTAGEFHMNDLPAGTYIFRTVDSCGGIKTLTVNVIGYQEGVTTVTITPACNSYMLHLVHQGVGNFVASYWLQKFNPVTNLWGHPATGATGPAGTLTALNAFHIQLGNNQNLQFQGNFRIMKDVPQVGNGNQVLAQCIKQIYTFEYSQGPKITDVYSFACSNSIYNAIVIATGFAPLTYRITSKDGLPFLVNNGTSNIFINLAPAVYSFQVEDSCGNILNSIFDISNPTLFPITPLGFCSGSSASLTVPDFAFLNYEWWKDNNTAAILSTTNQLLFPSFNPSTDNGTYHARIYYTGNPNSCVDFVVDYSISISPNAPNAGSGSNVAYCGNQGTIDLFSQLSGAYDLTGVWHETTSSGMLNNNLWDAANAAPGNYQFTYTVNGLCGVFDVSTVSILLKPMPDSPTASVAQTVCDAGELYLEATPISFGSYEWSGPNGFSSSVQNPMINNVSALNNGTYSVKAVSNGCESPASAVAVTVNALPKFKINQYCEANQYVVKVIPLDDSFDVSAVSYTWTGPENYSADTNPITITGEKKGIYTVSVMLPDGCSSESGITVNRTVCDFPTGVSPNGDGDNESFDLAGFDVSKFKIFNRYGRIVFEQDGYTNQWHGQDYNNRELPDATYYYYAELLSGEQKTGWVYLIRRN